MRDGDVGLIVSSFLERLDEVVERSVEAISQAVPSYARAGDAHMDDVRESVRENVLTLSTTLSHQRAVTSEELASIERVGARRAEAGIPLQDLLRAYRTVVRTCWDVLSDECRASPKGVLEASLVLAEAVLRYTDQVSTTVADAYLSAQRAIVREQEGARREFLADVLYGVEAQPEDILRRAHTFGYDLSQDYMALVGRGPEQDSRREAMVAGAVARLYGPSSADPIVLQKAEHTIALVPVAGESDPAAMPEKLVAELTGDWRFGVGGPEPGLEGIRRAYIEAREALEIGMGLELSGLVYRFDDLLLYHFLRSEPALLDRFVRTTLGPLIEYDERRKGELIQTLEAYFKADGSVKLTGAALFAHPHTISYRLKQVERLTGWSLQSSEDKLRLQLALRAHRLAHSRREASETPTR
ncbi:MAG: PucR family transcriptional regulator [Actinomycetota bacterium]